MGDRAFRVFRVFRVFRDQGSGIREQ